MLGIEHAFVHVDVDNLRAVFYLNPCHIKGCLVFTVQNQVLELGRSGHVTAFTDIDEQAVGDNIKRLQSAEATCAFMLGQWPRDNVAYRIGDGPDMRRGGTTTTAGQVKKTAFCKAVEFLPHDFRRLIELTKRIGQTRVEVCAEIAIRCFGQILQERPDFLEASTAITAYYEWAGMCHRIPEGLGILAGQHATAHVGKGHRNHQRHIAFQFLQYLPHGENGRLGVEGVKNGLYQEQVNPARNQSVGRFNVIRSQLVKRDTARTGIIHIGRDGGGLGRWPQHTGHKTGFIRIFGGHLVCYLPGYTRRRQVQLRRQYAQ